MDLPLKGLSLIWTQITSVARILLALPSCVLANAWGSIAGLPSSSPAGSCVFYEGVVSHTRRRPVANEFEYPVRVALLDLDDPPPWFAQSGQASEHLTGDQAREFAGTDGKVLLLTNPVSAGYIQNPISVHYCYSSSSKAGAGARDNDERRREGLRDPQQQQQRPGPDGGRRRSPERAPAEPALAIAEVTNTPWGDKVRFLFQPGGDKTPKALHVSPFMDMDNVWHLRASAPGQGLRLSVLVSHPKLGRYFDAHLVATRCTGPGAGSVNEAAGWGALLRYGFMPQRIAFWIYWQAVVLVAKGCPLHLKPEGAAFKAKAAERAKGALPAPRGGGRGGICPFEWADTKAWPWNL